MYLCAERHLIIRERLRVPWASRPALFNSRSHPHRPQNLTHLSLPWKNVFLALHENPILAPWDVISFWIMLRKKKNQMSFCTLESNCRPYHPFPPTLCNLYTGFQWNTPSTNVLCIWQTASSALTLFFVNKETKFPIHKRTNHFIFWVNESVFDLS